VWHGFNLPLIMSIIALVGGVLLYAALFRFLDGRQDGTPFLHRFRGKRIFENVLVTVTWRWARLLEGWLGTRRLQPQLMIIICLAVGVAALPLWNRTGALLPPPTAFDPVFAMIWVLGGLCAIS